MRENRTYGSEGGEGLPLPDPYQVVCFPFRAHHQETPSNRFQSRGK